MAWIPSRLHRRAVLHCGIHLRLQQHLLLPVSTWRLHHHVRDADADLDLHKFDEDDLFYSIDYFDGSFDHVDLYHPVYHVDVVHQVDNIHHVDDPDHIVDFDHHDFFLLYRPVYHEHTDHEFEDDLFDDNDAHVDTDDLVNFDDHLFVDFHRTEVHLHSRGLGAVWRHRFLW